MDGCDGQTVRAKRRSKRRCSKMEMEMGSSEAERDQAGGFSLFWDRES